MGRIRDGVIGFAGLGITVAGIYLATEQYEHAQVARHELSAEKTQHLGSITVTEPKDQNSMFARSWHAVDSTVHFLGDQERIVSNFFSPDSHAQTAADSYLANTEAAAFVAFVSFAEAGHRAWRIMHNDY